MILNKKFELWRSRQKTRLVSESVKGTKFGQLILMKIINIAATRRHILRLKCTKFDFGWDSAPDLSHPGLNDNLYSP